MKALAIGSKVDQLLKCNTGIRGTSLARRLVNNQQIDAYILKVIAEASHHAPNVATVIQPLSNAVRARLNLNVDTVSVYERLGKLARTCWVVIGGRRYAFTYDYSTKLIDLRQGTLRGRTIQSFDNSTSPATIARVVAAL
jgi:hypothetical protein